MNAFRRTRGRRDCRLARFSRRRGLQTGTIRIPIKGNAPDAALYVVRDIERAVGTYSKPGGPVWGPSWLLEAPGKAVSEDDEITRGLPTGKRLKDHVITPLRPGGAIPGAMKGDKSAAAIGFGKLRALVDLEIVRRPVSRKGGNRRFFLRANAYFLAAVAAIFRREDEPVLLFVVVAFRPAIVGALFEEHHLLRGLLLALLGGVELGKILV